MSLQTTFLSGRWSSRIFNISQARLLSFRHFMKPQHWFYSEVYMMILFPNLVPGFPSVSKLPTHLHVVGGKGCLFPGNGGSHREMAETVISLGVKDATCADWGPGCGHPWSWGSFLPSVLQIGLKNPFENLEVRPFRIPRLGYHARVRFGIRMNQKYCPTSKDQLCVLSHRTDQAMQDWWWFAYWVQWNSSHCPDYIISPKCF